MSRTLGAESGGYGGKSACLQAAVGSAALRGESAPGAIAHRQLDAEEAAAMLSSIPERAAVARLPALRAQALVPQLVRGPRHTEEQEHDEQWEPGRVRCSLTIDQGV